LEEEKLLSALVFFLLIIVKMPLCLAQDYKIWALHQQEQSQTLIKYYEKEALDLKKNVSSPFKGKGCFVKGTISCAKPQESKQPIETKQEASPSNLYVFVSFSMPKQALKSLALEAKKHKAVLVIRGLIDNSFLKTATFVKDLEESVILDPLLFREYNVGVVPTFIETHQAGYKKISGNVTLAYALSKFKEGDE
jgi:type-F conjugative transfer system pilin assembly protein TrbC